MLYNCGMKNFIYILLLCLGVIIGGVFVIYLQKKPVSTIKCNNQSITKNKTSCPISADTIANWKKPISTQKGYPIPVRTSEQTLQIYSFADKKVKDTQKTVLWGGGSAGFGENWPLVSPDMLYTVYIDQNTEELYLLSNETFESKKISPQSVDYITGWTPDSRKVIFHVKIDTVMSRKEGPGAEWEGQEQFRKNADAGFFVFNIDTGETIKLSPLLAIEGIINAHKVLVRGGFEQTANQLLVFNIDTFEADYAVSKEKFGFGAGQFDFTADGKYWTYALAPSDTTEGEVNIVYAPFPDKQDVVVDTGGWADVQWPKFSPNGSKIAYLHREGMIPPGYPNNYIWIYDISTAQKKKYDKGNRLIWIDNERMIVEGYLDIEKNTKKYYILDIAKGTSEQIYPES